jgi:hypothetical protein
LVERGPEKAGVGGSIPSLATIDSKRRRLLVKSGVKGKSKRSLQRFFPFAFYLFTFAFFSVASSA